MQDVRRNMRAVEGAGRHVKDDSPLSYGIFLVLLCPRGSELRWQPLRDRVKQQLRKLGASELGHLICLGEAQ